MDDIQRKLELIDRQLAGGGLAYFHRRIISTAPLLFVAVGLIAGILIRSVLSLPILFWLVLLAGCAIAAIAFLIFDFRFPISDWQSENKGWKFAYTALVCSVCLGAVRLDSFSNPEPDDIRNFVAEERKLATIRGVIVTEPYIDRQRDWEFARFKFTDPSSSFYLKLGEVETVAGWSKVAGIVRVQVDEPVLDLKAGDYIQAYCWLDRFRGAANPGQFDVTKYLARRNIFIAASVKSRDGIELLKSRHEGTFVKIKRKLRERATQALVGDLPMGEANRGLLEALLLGYRGDIDSSTYLAFRKTGLLHLISLSGLHLGILAGVIWWLCKTAGLMKRWRAIICIVAVGIFLLIVPPRAPTVRAAIICFVFCISFFFRRKSNPINTLSLAAIILLLIRPMDLFGAGWQLSFASVLGIILFTDRIHFFLYEKITNTLWFKQAPKSNLSFRIVAVFGHYILKLFSVGLAAWLGSAGILLYHFYTINPLTSIWTVIVFPFVALILTVGYLKIILSFLLPSAAFLLGLIAEGLSDFLIWLVKLFAQVDMSQIPIGHTPITMIILYYCFVLFAFFVYFRRPVIKKVICTVTVLLMIAFLGVTKWQRTHRNNLIMTCLDVGHGQAILAQLPGGANILFDAGSLHKSDVGRRIVCPFLEYNGINRIDSIIISHNDVDHINGVPEIIGHCKVNDTYANESFFSNADQWGTAKFLKESLSEKGLEMQLLGEELNMGSDARIKIIWPNEKICADSVLSDNDKSAVCLIEFAGRRILLCSDIEKFAQRELLRLCPNLKADVIVVPHHGSAKTLEADFLENLEAKVLMCSCGRRDYEKQQLTEAKNNAKLLYTAKDGAITVRIDNDGTIKSRTQPRSR